MKGKGRGFHQQHGREMQAGAITPEVVLGRGAVTGGGVKGCSVPAPCLGPSSNLTVHGKGEYVPCSFPCRGREWLVLENQQPTVSSTPSGHLPISMFNREHPSRPGAHTALSCAPSLHLAGMHEAAEPWPTVPNHLMTSRCQSGF